jgi:hypothetical protein
MADAHGKDSPPETYVKRTGREIADLRSAFGKSWIFAVCIILVLGLYGAYEMGLFHKKDDPRDLSAGILTMATRYQDLNDKYQKLQAEVQQKNDEEKEAQILG